MQQCRFTATLALSVVQRTSSVYCIYLDLTSSDRQSEHFLRKLNRARFALARTDSIRSLSESMKGKPPYRRAVSVPLHLLAKGIPVPKCKYTIDSDKIISFRFVAVNRVGLKKKKTHPTAYVYNKMRKPPKNVCMIDYCR